MCILNEGYAFGCGHTQVIQLVQSCAAGFDYHSRKCYSDDHTVLFTKALFAKYLCSKCHDECTNAIHRACIRSFTKDCHQGSLEGWSEAIFEQEAVANSECEIRELAEFEVLCEEYAQENADAHNGGSRNDDPLVDLESIEAMYDNSDEEDKGDEGDIDIEEEDDKSELGEHEERLFAWRA